MSAVRLIAHWSNKRTRRKKIKKNIIEDSDNTDSVIIPKKVSKKAKKREEALRFRIRKWGWERDLKRTKQRS